MIPDAQDRRNQLIKRTKHFGLRVIKLVENLPDTIAGRTVANQILRSATSVGANYRAACRGRSEAEFTAKLGIVIEEADETAYWLEILVESEMVESNRLKDLMIEANELVALFTAAVRTTKAKRYAKSSGASAKHHESGIKYSES